MFLAEDGGISIFSHPFSTLVLCLQFPLCCTIISSTPCGLTVTIPSFYFYIPFLVFCFASSFPSFMHSPSPFFIINPWALGCSSSSYALRGFSRLLAHVHATFRGQMVTTHCGKPRHVNIGINFMTLILRVSWEQPLLTFPKSQIQVSAVMNLGFDQLTLLKRLAESKIVAQEKKTPTLPTLTSKLTRKHWSFRRRLSY